MAIDQFYYHLHMFVSKTKQELQCKGNDVKKSLKILNPNFKKTSHITGTLNLLYKIHTNGNALFLCVKFMLYDL